MSVQEGISRKKKRKKERKCSFQKLLRIKWKTSGVGQIFSENGSSLLGEFWAVGEHVYGDGIIEGGGPAGSEGERAVKGSTRSASSEG